MQINNHLTPAHFGHGGRPDHAGHGAGKGAQSPTVAAEIEPATVTDTTTAVAPVEETEGAEKHKNSVAHEARRHLANLAESKALGGHNFGWLVSQIARGLFNPADYAPASEDGEDTGVIVDETAGDPTTEIDTAIDEAPVVDASVAETSAPDVEAEEDPVAGLLDALTDEQASTASTVDPVVDLVDGLLADDADDSDAV